MLYVINFITLYANSADNKLVIFFLCFPENSIWHFLLPASVAQLDARPTGGQEVVGSTPAEVGNILCGDWSWNIFYSHSLPSADSRRAVVSFWQKNVHNIG